MRLGAAISRPFLRYNLSVLMMPDNKPLEAPKGHGDLDLCPETGLRFLMDVELPGAARITVHMDGRTDQTINYSDNCDRSKILKSYSHGIYTMKRSKKKLIAVLKVHSYGMPHSFNYFITHGMPVKYNNKERRAKFRMFLDLIRKEKNFLGYVWVTEMHKGLNGTPEMKDKIHHHMVLKFSEPWNYKKNKRIVELSQRYSGSINGLDAEPIKGNPNEILKYMMKTLYYMVKDLNNEPLPFRWWGSSRIVRSVEIEACQVSLITKPLWYNGKVMPLGFNRCAYVPTFDAIKLCGLATAKSERTLKKAKKTNTAELEQTWRMFEAVTKQRGLNQKLNFPE